MQCNLIKYCVLDVKLLREGCLTFQHNFHKLTWFCPFKMTIVSACSHDFQLNHMEEDTITGEPMCDLITLQKIKKFAKFLGLPFVSPSTFYSVQHLYTIQAISVWGDSLTTLTGKS